MLHLLQSKNSARGLSICYIQGRSQDFLKGARSGLQFPFGRYMQLSENINATFDVH